MSEPQLSFGTDGVRARYGEGPLQPEPIERLGVALGAFLHDRGQAGGPVLVGGDTRESRFAITELLCRGLARQQIQTCDLGVLPTTALALVGQHYGASCAAVISASHNPAADNGIKIFTGAGEKLSDNDARWIEQEWSRSKLVGPAPAATTQVRDDAGEFYLECLLAATDVKQLSGLKIALDMSHGAAYELGPTLFERLGAEVITIGNQPNGLNINDHCGSLYPQKLAATVRHEQAHFGVAVDGDADRCILVDETGVIVDGDGILAAMAVELSATDRLSGDTVVGTVMTNFGLELFLRERSIALERTPVGDKHISARLREASLGLGGEPSGHVIFGSDLKFLGDGLYSALRVAQLLRGRGVSLSRATEELTLVPQVLLKVPIASRPRLEDISGFREKLADAEKRFGNNGRVVVRYSGTEPVCRVMTEGTDPGLVTAVADELAAFLKVAVGGGP